MRCGSGQCNSTDYAGGGLCCLAVWAEQWAVPCSPPTTGENNLAGCACDFPFSGNVTAIESHPYYRNHCDPICGNSSSGKFCDFSQFVTAVATSVHTMVSVPASNFFLQQPLHWACSSLPATAHWLSVAMKLQAAGATDSWTTELPVVFAWCECRQFLANLRHLGVDSIPVAPSCRADHYEESPRSANGSAVGIQSAVVQQTCRLQQGNTSSNMTAWTLESMRLHGAC